MVEPSSEVLVAAELATLRVAYDRLERRAAWQTVGSLLALAAAAGALAVPFVMRRVQTNEVVAKQLRIVDDYGTTRAAVLWDPLEDEARLVMYDGQQRRRVELGTLDDQSAIELVPGTSTAHLRAQVGEEDVTVSLRYEPEQSTSSWLDFGVHRELVKLTANAGPSTMASSVDSDRVSLHLGRGSEGLSVADLELDELGPSFELRAETAGRARLHVPSGKTAPEMLVEAPDGATARLTPLPPEPPATPPPVVPPAPP